MAEIEYFYSAHSAYAYLGSARLMEIARKTGRTISHRPIDLRRVIAEAGSQRFTERSAAHVRYFFGREIDRWAEYRSAPVMSGTPTHHSNDITLPNCLLIAGLQRGDNIDHLAHVLLEAHWRDDADLADAATLVRLGTTAGFEAERLLEAAGSADVLAAYEAYTAEAIQRSVFGSPTYIVDGDMFYGQDHLEMVERALDRPFIGAPTDGC